MLFIFGLLDSLLVITEFLRQVLRQGATNEHRLEIAVFEGTGLVWSKISPYQKFYVSQN